jgi:hypothetical protein
MRRILAVAFLALAASVAVALAVPTTAKAATPPWFQVHTYVAQNGPTTVIKADVVNVGWMTHTGNVSTVLLRQSSFFPWWTAMVSRSRVVTLKPFQHASVCGVGFNAVCAIAANLLPGHYAATTGALHIFQPGDPPGLLGASTSDTVFFDIP